MFDDVQRTLQSRPAGAVRYVILDFERVTGADASAALSLAKLRHLCRRAGAVLVYGAVARNIAAALGRETVRASRGEHEAPLPFDDLNTALAWREERVLAAAESGRDVHQGPAGARPPGEAQEDAGFAAWLQDELGAGVDVTGFLARLQRRRFETATTLYRQGDPADGIDIVADGRLVIERAGTDGRRHRPRTLATRTVVGEMGFVPSRSKNRSVCVASNRVTRSGTSRGTPDGCPCR
ncbi:cyclic nucleotide-binding domain-containing protein [Rubrivivax sp. RP6-9]|uniref:cyclic nucleotide-binding domain-containing protein n=1 Tax=Rubrivivax sp. RP6-9 TaxID=3415750 RepID=UPI003CC5B095